MGRCPSTGSGQTNVAETPALQVCTYQTDTESRLGSLTASRTSL